MRAAVARVSGVPGMHVAQPTRSSARVASAAFAASVTSAVATASGAAVGFSWPSGCSASARNSATGTATVQSGLQ